MTSLKTFSFLISAAALLAGCSSAPITAPVASANNATPVANTGTTGGASANSAAASTVASVTVPAYLDPKNELSTKRSVFFDYDDFSIKKDYVAVVERHGKFLAANPKVAIKVEGHTDERGGTEYNLALGQKRAEATLRALMVYGVKDAQVEAVSWGKESPKATGHDESAWAQNRRADLQYPNK